MLVEKREGDGGHPSQPPSPRDLPATDIGDQSGESLFYARVPVCLRLSSRIETGVTAPRLARI